MFPAAGLRDEAARSLAKRAIQEPGKADVLASNAGIYPFGPTRQVSGQDVDAVFGEVADAGSASAS